MSMDYYNHVIDFVIPLHRYHHMLRTVIESIQKLYSPRTIYIITPTENIDIINKNNLQWKLNNTIITLPEETFFMNIYHLHYNDIFNKYHESEGSREFGWWYQQLIKLGAVQQISGLSDPYVVWDSDLIPITKWELYPTLESPYFRFAILQEKSKSELITQQYRDSLLKLTGLPICDPELGTFVPHHYILYHRVLHHLFEFIEKENPKNHWIFSIIDLSAHFIRFSEYRTVSSFMKEFYPDLLHYYPFTDFGADGIRIREPKSFLKEQETFLYDNKIDFTIGISYTDFITFVKEKYRDKIPSYLQIEHI